MTLTARLREAAWLTLSVTITVETMFIARKYLFTPTYDTRALVLCAARDAHIQHHPQFHRASPQYDTDRPVDCPEPSQRLLQLPCSPWSDHTGSATQSPWKIQRRRKQRRHGVLLMRSSPSGVNPRPLWCRPIVRGCSSAQETIEKRKADRAEKQKANAAWTLTIAAGLPSLQLTTVLSTVAGVAVAT
ncbi:hypothetical protein C8Q76DRAFT_21632 [Earliella scabrosa]|nr:hypothetical protein C8Q76DRAFT_21632 [Earliella scabrosa]